MNKRDLAIQRNNTARLFQQTSKIHRNCIRCNIGNTKAHELAKFEECWKLKKEGKEFITEAVLENGKRCDLVILDDREIVEIIASESEESIVQKELTYPLPIRKIYVQKDKPL